MVMWSSDKEISFDVYFHKCEYCMCMGREHVGFMNGYWAVSVSGSGIENQQKWWLLWL